MHISSNVRNSYASSIASNNKNAAPKEAAPRQNSESFVKSNSDDGFFSIKPTTMGNVKKFGTMFAVTGAIITGLMTAGTSLGLMAGLGIGGVMGGVSGVIFGGGRPTGQG